jgi:hypothetical protein
MRSKKAETTPVGSTSLDGFIAKMEHPHKAGIKRPREVSIGLDGRISEEVEWNAPSFKLASPRSRFTRRRTSNSFHILEPRPRATPKPSPLRIPPGR